MSSDEKKVKESFNKCGFCWADEMKDMLGKVFPVLYVDEDEEEIDSVGLPCPVSKDHMYY